MNKKKLLFFACVTLAVTFFILESISFRVLKTLNPSDKLLNTDLLFAVEDGYLRLRKNLYENFHKFDHFRVGSKNPKAKFDLVRKGIKGVAFLNKKEGFISTNFGDFVLNKWGFRGPYFVKKKSKKIYRVITLGGSTTLGWKVTDEETYPRILERMLNRSINKDINVQVINAGMYYHNSCNVNYFFKKDYLEFEPDMILLMSGWNDINKLRNKEIHSFEDYCPEPLTLRAFHSFRLLEYFMSELLDKPSVSKLGTKILSQNMKYLERNLEEIINISKDKGISVGLITMPSIMGKNSSIDELKKIPQLIGIDKKEILFHRDVGVKINQLYAALAKRHRNAFKINNGISFNSEGKVKYFSDLIHQTPIGNRVQAYSVYKALNSKLKVHPIKTIGYLDDERLSPKRLELEYIKSIFTQNEVEDLSSSGCIVFHKTCDVFQKKNDISFLNSVVEFSLGSLLQFRENLKEPKVYSTFDEILSKALKLDPDYSLVYWVFSIIKRGIGADEEAKDLMQKALSLNPKLQEIDFEYEYKKFQILRNKNPFVTLSDLILVVKNAPSNVSIYTLFESIKKQDAREKEEADSGKEMQKKINLLSNCYHSKPLLGYSIFEFTLDYLRKNKKNKEINDLLPKIISLKPEYGYSQLFSKYYEDMPIQN